MLIIISDMPGPKFGMGNDFICHNAVHKAAHSLVLRVLVYYCILLLCTNYKEKIKKNKKKTYQCEECADQ